jgi:hypothetical protein
MKDILYEPSINFEEIEHNGIILLNRICNKLGWKADFIPFHDEYENCDCKNSEGIEVEIKSRRSPRDYINNSLSLHNNQGKNFILKLFLEHNEKGLFIREYNIVKRTNRNKGFIFAKRYKSIYLTEKEVKEQNKRIKNNQFRKVEKPFLLRPADWKKQQKHFIVYRHGLFINIKKDKAFIELQKNPNWKNILNNQLDENWSKLTRSKAKEVSQ